MRKSRFIFLSSLLLAGLVFSFLQHRSVASQQRDPTGKYTAITSYRTYLSLFPTSPGSSSDKPGFVRIVDEHGKGYGEIPVPQLQFAGVEWTQGGARIQLVGEWDFEKPTCFYWSDDQTKKIFVKVY